jgi:predicted phage baseplate assembly protein
VPLPLPDLDDRTFDELVAEARALIPRYAPQWTDHNIHDPGITMIELLASVVEQDVYRVNRIPDRHRRKFLALAGVVPRAPVPHTIAVEGVSPAGLRLPAGTTLLATSPHAPPLTFRLRDELDGRSGRIAEVRARRDGQLVDLTRPWGEGRAIDPFGTDPQTTTDPEMQPALYLGFESALAAGRELGVWLELSGPDATGRAAVADEAIALGDASYVKVHHAVRVAWDVLAGGTWRSLDPVGGEIDDATRGFTLTGLTRVCPPVDVPLAALTAGAPPRAWLRARWTGGTADASPRIAAVSAPVAAADQVELAHQLFLREGALDLAALLTVGETQKLSIELNPAGRITALAAGTDGDPEALVLSAGTDRADLGIVFCGSGTGLPGQIAALPGAPIAGGDVRVWVTGAGGTQRWRAVTGLDAAGPADRVFVLDASHGIVRFGDGRHGAVVPAGAAVLAAFDTTRARAGAAISAAALVVAGADAVNEAILPANAADGAALRLAGTITPGADGEDVAEALGRAMETLWAHERLLELAASARTSTLDHVPRERAVALRAPERGTTLLDLERLALAVPGAPVARARAWAEFDPRLACRRAPGTVTIVVVPWLPQGRPSPSPGLLRAIRRSLELRRVLGTRLLVAGPGYVDVEVRVAVRLRRGVIGDGVRDRIAAAVAQYLDPLTGGARGEGWPFGRDVHAAELLAVVDGVRDVDGVTKLEVTTDVTEPGCGDICVGPLDLVALRSCDVTID